MAPPSSLPKLAELVATEVAIDVCDAVLDHVQTLVASLGPGRISPPADALEMSTAGELGQSVQRVVLFAQNGSGDDTTAAQTALRTVCVALFATVALDPPSLDHGLPEGVTLETAIGVAMIAALGRLRLARNEPVSTRELAALSSLSIRQIQQLIAGGKLRASGNQIVAHAARTWLATRHISV